MFFGQKRYKKNGKMHHGRWIPHATREAALEEGSELISILELCCTVEEFEAWTRQLEENSKDPRKVRPVFPFKGPFYADFDDAEHLEGLKKELVVRLDALQKQHGLEDEDFQLWFTGSKGFHLVLDPRLFGAESMEHRNLPDIYKMFGCHLGLGDLMDPVVYSKGRGRLWRAEGSLRSNGCRKIPISMGQLRGLDIRDLRLLSRRSWWYRPELRINPPTLPSLKREFHNAAAIVEQREKKKIKRKKAFKAGSEKPATVQLAKALERLPASFCDNYGEWLMIGMALHDGTDGSMEGLELWRRWSSQSEKYDPTVLEHNWESFHSDPGGITVGTLFYLSGGEKSAGSE